LSGRSVAFATLAFERSLAAIALNVYLQDRGVVHEPVAIAKLDKYQLLILDDIAYVTKDQAETSVLFELIAARYERRSLLITG
jgi:hypothetical protein